MAPVRPLVSVVMPAYNAEAFIGEAIRSVLAQTYANWELVVVDDASTDGTCAVVEAFAKYEPRIRLIRNAANCGSAFVPRLTAVRNSRGEYVCSLDADDTVESRFVEKLVDRASETGAVWVLPEMLKWTPEAVTGFPEMFDGVDTDRVYTGRELVRFTLDGWRIGANGLAKTDFFRNVAEAHTWRNLMNDDELLTRHQLLVADKVAIARAEYYYRVNPQSITRKFTLKKFDPILTDAAIVELTASEFGKDSEEYLLACRQQFHGLVDAMVTRATMEKGEMRTTVDKIIKTHLAGLDRQALRRARASWKMRGILAMPLPWGLKCAAMRAYFRLMKAVKA